MPRIFANGKVEPDYLCVDCEGVLVGYYGGVCEGCANVRKVLLDAKVKKDLNRFAWAISIAGFLVALIVFCLVYGK